MLTPSDHAAAILRWLGDQRLTQVETALASLGEDDALLRAADALADAADSDVEAQRSAGLSALFAGVVEPLNDGFTPAGRALYARVFARIVWRVASRQPQLAAALAAFAVRDEATLLAHYQAARRGATPLPAGTIAKVLVLSRVTIGADILLTSVAVQRLRQRFPTAELVLVGDGKLAGLFGGGPGVRVRALAYARRGPLRERLASWLGLVEAVNAERPDLVFSPDSRLDQLGVLPLVADPARYWLWENLQAEGQPARSLATLLDEWLARRLALPLIPAALPRVTLDAASAALRERLRAALGSAPLVAVKLDHGGNPAKALPRAAELALLRRCRELGWRVLLDRGFGESELANSDALLADLGWRARDLDDSGKGLGEAVAELRPDQLAGEAVVRFHGSISGWAAALAGCGMALSYDSVGHHLAAALGVPVAVAFTGHADPAFAVAWQPRGAASVTVVEIPSARKDQPDEWQRLLAALPRPVLR